MKNLKYLLIVVGLMTMMLSGKAQSTFTFSRMDGTHWQCDSLSPQSAVMTGVGSKIGSFINKYNGDLYWIDPKRDTLIKNYVEVGPLSWYDDKLWDAQPIHGFVISSDGVGWLASQNSDDGVPSFLVKVNLLNGAIIPIGPLGDGSNVSPVNGISVIPEPSIWIIMSIFLAFVVRLHAKNK